jgi:hypothetical protein
MKCKIHGVELICPACFASSGGKIGGKAKTTVKQQAARLNILKAQAAHRKAARVPKPEPLDRSAIWGRVDALAYFEKHPQDEVTAADLIKAATKPKKYSAQKYAAQRLFLLFKEGHVSKIRRGVYRLVNQPK